MSEDEGGEAGDLFKEPADFYEPEKKPTVVHHRTLQGQELTLHLVGHNPLWVGTQIPMSLHNLHISQQFRHVRRTTNNKSARAIFSGKQAAH